MRKGRRSVPATLDKGKEGFVADEAVLGALVVGDVVGLADAHRLVALRHVVLGVAALIAPAPVLMRDAVTRPDLVAAETATVVVETILLEPQPRRESPSTAGSPRVTIVPRIAESHYRSPDRREPRPRPFFAAVRFCGPGRR
jgi:hypothetical protein